MNSYLKFKRGTFWLLYYLFARHLPRSNVVYSFKSKAIRAFVLKRLLKTCGSNINVEPKVIFYRLSHTEIGDNSGIGMHSYVGKVKIGCDVMIGEELIAISQNHNYNDINVPMREQGWKNEEIIEIEDDVWIGSRVTLLPGIRIGKGSIVGAGAVVTKNVSTFSIVAGNPAKVIGKRINN